MGLGGPYWVYGYITDSGGDPVPNGVEVTIYDVSEGQGLPTVYTYNDDGRYMGNIGDLAYNGDTIRVSSSYGGESGQEEFVVDIITYPGGYQQDVQLSSSLTPPTVVTSPCQTNDVGTNSATMRGQVTDDGGATTSRYIQWDTDGPPYANTSPLCGTGEGTYAYVKDELTQGALYFYRAHATNSEGEGNGSDATFITKPTWSAVDPFSSTPTGPNSIQLSWTGQGVNGVDGIYVEYTSGGYCPDPWNPGDYTPVSPGQDGEGRLNSSPFTQSGLNPGTLYWFKAWAYAKDGSPAQYSDGTCLKPFADNVWTENSTTESIPGELAVTTVDITTGQVEETQVVLTGNVTDTGNGNVDHRYMEWGVTTGVYPYNFDEGSGGTGAYSNTASSNINAGTFYYFRARITKSGLDDGVGTEKTFLTKPDPPTGFGADAQGSSTSILLTWTNTGAGCDGAYIEFHAGGDSPPSPWNIGDETELGVTIGTQKLHQSLNPDTHYWYKMWGAASDKSYQSNGSASRPYGDGPLTADDSTEPGTGGNYIIEGYTRDSNGDILGECQVRLYRTSDGLRMETKTSGVDGYFSFNVSDNTTAYFVVGRKDGTPNVFGTTDDNLTGIAT